MATSIEMSRVVAAATGVSPRTVLLLVRTLGERELLSRGGRGKNAPAMSPIDFSRVLISILTTERPADAPRAVEAFGQLRLLTGAIPLGEADHSLKFAPAVGSKFEESLGALIEALSALPDYEPPPVITVSCNVSELGCSIEVQGRRFTYDHASLRDRADQKTDNIEPFFALRAQYQKSKVRVRREIRQDVLAAVAVNFRAS